MKKLLVVDDQARIRELVKATLEREEYRIFEARNGSEAVRIALAEKPDLVIMDVVMPEGIDGLEATRVIKQEAKDAYVIVLTGELFDARSFFQAGADDYLTKPFSPLSLLEKVERILG